MSILRTQPQGSVRIDWTNPITQGMILAFVHGHAAHGYSANGNIYYPFANTTKVNTPIGQGIQTTNMAYSVVGPGFTSNSYSLFAVGTATSNSATQSALDMDNSSPRYFQFRLSAGRVDFIPFNTSATPAVTGQATSSVQMSLAELNRGFTMGATASPSRTACFQNGIITVGSTPTNLSTPSGAPIGVGARLTGTQSWSTGGLAMVAAWNRTLSDAEMVALSRNPWQLFAPLDDDFDMVSLSGQSFSFNASGGFVTLGSAPLLYTLIKPPSGGIVTSGNSTVTTGRGTLTLDVIGSGGTTLSGTSPSRSGVVWSQSGSVVVTGQAYVSNGTGGTTVTIKTFKRCRRPRFRIDSK